VSGPGAFVETAACRPAWSDNPTGERPGNVTSPTASGAA